MSAREPTPEVSTGAIARRLAATRPAFLSVAVAGALLGMASAVADRLALRPLESAAARAAAVIAHAGVNVIDDDFDAANGSDAANAERLFPYTGGSRMIQNGVLSTPETWVLAVSLLALVLPAGLWLAWRSGAGLIAIGAAGLATGWAHSAPPLALAGLLALPASAFAARQLVRHAVTPERLAPAIRATIAAAHVEGALVAAALFVSRAEVLA